MNTSRLVVSLLASLALTGALGCQSTAQIHAPEGFAALDDQADYAYRAASADGVVIAVRSEPNRPAANLSFWAAAVDRDLRSRDYAPDGERTVKSAAGLVGRELHYTRNEKGRTYRYWVAVFVSGKKVWLVETGGDGAKVQGKVEASLEDAIASLTLG